MPDFLARHADKIVGVLHCFDRVVITGTVPEICHPRAMAVHLKREGYRIFDYARWAEPLRDRIREHAQRIAHEQQVQIEFVRKTTFRKEDRVRAVLEARGSHPGLVHILSAMETCPSFSPWHDKHTGETFLRHKEAKCLHYYFYFIHARYGLCYLRVPTWAPFRLQFYFNGHNFLASELRREGIDFKMVDNAFVDIADFGRATQLADGLDAAALHRELDRLVRRYCPVLRELSTGCRWSVHQVEYATDIIFKSTRDLGPLYDALVRTAVHAIKADNVATFLGRKLTATCTAEIGNDFQTRIEGTRLKHYLGPVAVKMYDKLGYVLRIETTANDVTFFKHHRMVEHRNGTCEYKLASVRKSIYSLRDLRELLSASNRRYLDFLSAVDDPSPGLGRLEKVARPASDRAGRNHRGFNLFHGDDLKLFEIIQRGEFNISGLQARDLKKHFPNATPSAIGRMLKRLRVHGLLKKIGNRYKYYLTALGRTAAAAALKLRELVVIPAMAMPRVA